MDIYEYLKLDHDNVSNLFKQFNNTDSIDRKKQIVELIAQELLPHAQSEQETFYKALSKHVTSKEDALHGLEEHHEIKDKIKQILKFPKNLGETWAKSVNKLEELVNHHVKEEEGSIFRKAKQVLSEDEAYIIKEKMHYLKRQLMV